MDNIFSSFYLFKEHKKLTLTKPKYTFIQYRDFRVYLITGEKTDEDIHTFLDELKLIKVGNQFKDPIVVHLFYELGYFSNELDQLVSESSPLAIYLEYGKGIKENIYSYEQDENFSIESLAKVKKKKYEENFQKIQKDLRAGEYYQLNYTIPFYLRANQEVNPVKYIDLIMGNAAKVGAYSHGTYIDSLGKLFLSNSPECLFQIKKKASGYKIQTMPIKGTKKVTDTISREKAWKDLTGSLKEQAELYMITDLMKNDLTKLTLNKSTVLNKKLPLNVPGLVHQFSLIESDIKKGVSLKEIVRCLFPGGSITGAPKKAVMKRIHNLEDNPRSFYCGSTVLCFEESFCASINIRSAEVDYIQNELCYGAGGGITLDSQYEEEFEEVMLKLKSFLLSLT